MANDVLIYNTTTIAPTFATNATIASASAIQASPVDFGTPRALNWLARIALNMTAAPTAGKTIDVYIGWSSASNAGLPAGLGTVSGAYTGYNSASQGTPQLEWIGSLTLSAVSTLQTADIGVVTPKLQWGTVVLYNSADQSVGSATAATMTFTPIKDQVQ